MGVEEIIEFIEIGAKLISIGSNAYNAIQSTLSETDLQKIQAALAASQAATALIRPQVDAALDEAANNK